MVKTIVITLTLFATVILSSTATAAEPEKQPAQKDPVATCPMHAAHMAAAATAKSRADGSSHHGGAVDSRHDTLGMSHATSTHSFRLFADGGAIELRANDATDQTTIDAIRTHLRQVNGQFNAGDFSTPAFVHGYQPDGVSGMERSRGDITYRYESLRAGGRIRIVTKSTAALAAIHDFLRFQVTEHRTGNTGNVEVDR